MLLIIFTHEASLLLALVIHLLIILLQVTLEGLFELVKGEIKLFFSLNIAVFNLSMLSFKFGNLLFKITLPLNMSLFAGLSDIVASAFKFILFGGLSVLLVLDLLLQVAHLFLSLILSLFHVFLELLQSFTLSSKLLFESLSTIFQNLQLLSN